MGPGNFTGIRAGVSAAKGLSLGLQVELLGVNTFQAIAEQKCSVIFNNKFGKFLLQRFDAGKEITPVRQISENDAELEVMNSNQKVFGFQMHRKFNDCNLYEEVKLIDIEKVGFLASKKITTNGEPVKPFYFVMPRISEPKK